MDSQRHENLDDEPAPAANVVGVGQVPRLSVRALFHIESWGGRKPFCDHRRLPGADALEDLDEQHTMLEQICQCKPGQLFDENQQFKLSPEKTNKFGDFS